MWLKGFKELPVLMLDFLKAGDSQQRFVILIIKDPLNVVLGTSRLM